MLLKIIQTTAFFALLIFAGAVVMRAQARTALSHHTENIETRSARATFMTRGQNNRVAKQGVAGQTKQARNAISSVYTSLKSDKCRTIKLTVDEGGFYQGLCAGAGGYQLEVLEGDLRQSINVIAPGGKKTYKLDLWSVASNGGFSLLGDIAEWRVVRKNNKIVPAALIVRYNVSENPEDASQITSYLVVTKITAGQVCVIDRVKPGASANQTARELADAAVSKACLGSAAETK